MTAIGPGTAITPEIRLIRCLGRGGMGSVWAAESAALGTEVVVKLLDESLGQSEVGRARFIREAEAATKVRSPHVVQTYDFGPIDGAYFLTVWTSSRAGR